MAFGTGVLDEDDVLGVMDDYVEEAYDEAEGDKDGAGDESGGEEGGGRRGLLSGRRGIAAVGALFQKGGGGSGGMSNAMKALPLTGMSGRRAQALAKQGFSYQLGDSDEEDGDDGPLRPGGR